MSIKGWNPLALLPVAFIAVFIVLAVRRARTRKRRG
jgi:hypothetical protein